MERYGSSGYNAQGAEAVARFEAHLSYGSRFPGLRVGLESLILWSLWKVATRISLVDHFPGRWEVHQLAS